MRLKVKKSVTIKNTLHEMQQVKQKGRNGGRTRRKTALKKYSASQHSKNSRNKREKQRRRHQKKVLWRSMMMMFKGNSNESSPLPLLSLVSGPKPHFQFPISECLKKSRVPLFILFLFPLGFHEKEIKVLATIGSANVLSSHKKVWRKEPNEKKKTYCRQKER